MKHFLRVFLGSCMLFFLSNILFGQMPGQIPLKPQAIPQFVDALPHFAGQRVNASGDMVIRYDSTQQIAVSTGTVLATGTVGSFAPTVGLARFWGYSVSNNGGTTFTPSHWPSFTIEARRGTPVNVTYVNNLFDATYSRVNLIADQTLHWADPLMAMNAMLMTPYTGPIPVSPHLHGGEVASESDGGPESWFTPGYAITGPSWGMGGTDQNYYYPNTQEAGTLWYHDHSLGVTRLNVYAGLAGFYFLRGPEEETAKLPGWSGDDLVQEVTPVGKTNIFTSNPYLPEIEIAFQDRMFDNTGALYFPNLPTNPMVHPFWTPEFIGDVITVNGKTWPYLSVAPRKYRFRLLNGSNARFYELQIQSGNSLKNSVPIVQVGTDGGLLDTPVSITALGGKLLLAPGERADVVIDFSTSAGKSLTLTNSANTPYPNGGPPNGTTVGRILQFIVNGKMVSAANPLVAGTDKSLVPASLRATPLVKLTNFAGATTTGLAITKKRQLTLNEVMGMGGPLEVLVNNSKFDMNGMMVPGLGETEIPTEGTTELWQIINATADAHPIHLHLVQFQLVGRQAFDLKRYNAVYNAAFTGGLYVPSVGPPLTYSTPNADGAVGGNPAVTPFLMKALIPANLNEQGWKDTYIVYPGEVTTFVIRFAPTDKPITALPADLVFEFDPSLGPGYVWHCHIIDHEDNEMMRPYAVLPNPARTAAVLAKSALIAPSNKTNDGFMLEQNSPNPFSTVTEIRYSIPTDSHVQLKLYSIMGVEIRTLIDADKPAGVHNIRVGSENLASGTYFYRLKSGPNIATKKMIILK